MLLSLSLNFPFIKPLKGVKKFYLKINKKKKKKLYKKIKMKKKSIKNIKKKTF